MMFGNKNDGFFGVCSILVSVLRTVLICLESRMKLQMNHAQSRGTLVCQTAFVHALIQESCNTDLSTNTP